MIRRARDVGAVVGRLPTSSSARTGGGAKVGRAGECAERGVGGRDVLRREGARAGRDAKVLRGGEHAERVVSGRDARRRALRPCRSELLVRPIVGSDRTGRDHVAVGLNRHAVVVIIIRASRACRQGKGRRHISRDDFQPITFSNILTTFSTKVLRSIIITDIFI